MSVVNTLTFVRFAGDPGRNDAGVDRDDADHLDDVFLSAAIGAWAASTLATRASRPAARASKPATISRA